jgi:cyclophilin family peptidyl-prolyl cis-trans isomerase
MFKKTKTFKSITIFLLVFGVVSMTIGCDKEIAEGVKKSDLSKDVELVTDYGTIIVRLYDETPNHRNNFIKLVNEQFYDGIAFHRVIDNFIIQAGNPTSKVSKTYNPEGDPALSYTIESEFSPILFHKRGALGAARESDIVNPNRSSSGFQFYIVQRGKQTDSIINKATERVNLMTARNNVFNRTALKDDFEKYQRLQLLSNEEASEDDIAQLLVFEKKFDSLSALEFETMQKFNHSESQREVYKTIGGAPHLDQNYTVFGEVINGMNIVDSIAVIDTDLNDKPLNNVSIISARMIQRKLYD